MTLTREELTDRFLKDLLRQQGTDPDKALEAAVILSSTPNLAEVRFEINPKEPKPKVRLYAADTLNGKDYGPTPIRYLHDLNDSRDYSKRRSLYFQQLSQTTPLSFQDIHGIDLYSLPYYIAHIVGTSLSDPEGANCDLEFFVNSKNPRNPQGREV